MSLLGRICLKDTYENLILQISLRGKIYLKDADETFLYRSQILH